MQCRHKSCIRIFEHNFGGFQAKIRRRTMWRGIAALPRRRSRQMGGTAKILTKKPIKFAGKACADTVTTLSKVLIKTYRLPYP